jgi:hypothetical protein
VKELQPGVGSKAQPVEDCPGIKYQKEQAGKKESDVNQQFVMPCSEFLIVKLLVGRNRIIVDIFKKICFAILEIDFPFLADQH